MKEYFDHTGFVVDTARDIDEAERLIMTGEYTVLIQDLRFARRHNPDIGIVVLTAYGSQETESEARIQGADAFLQKPQRLSQVAQVVRGLIESPRRRLTPQDQ